MTTVGSDTETFQVTVNNVAPDLKAVGRPERPTKGVSCSLANIGTLHRSGLRQPSQPPGEAVGDLHRIDRLGRWDSDRCDVATVDRTGGRACDTAGSFDGSHTYADNGIYTVTVTVNDDDGGSDTETFEVTVNNVAPTLTVVGRSERRRRDAT